MLTQNQAHALAYIVEYQSSHGGVSPSYDDMMAAVGLKSKGHLHAVMSQLESRGFVRRLYKRSRAIEVLRLATVPPAEKQRWRLFVFDDQSKRLREI